MVPAPELTDLLCVAGELAVGRFSGCTCSCDPRPGYYMWVWRGLIGTPFGGWEVKWFCLSIYWYKTYMCAYGEP